MLLRSSNYHFHQVLHILAEVAGELVVPGRGFVYVDLNFVLEHGQFRALFAVVLPLDF